MVFITFDFVIDVSWNGKTSLLRPAVRHPACLETEAFARLCASKLFGRARHVDGR